MDPLAAPSSAGTHHDYHVPPPPGGTARDALAVQQKLVADFAAFAREHEKRSARARQLLEGTRRRLGALLGPRTQKRLVAFSREQRLTNYGLGPLTAGGPPKGLEAAKRRAAERSRQLLAKAGVDARKLARLYEKANHDFARVLVEARRPSRRLEVVGPEDVPVAVLSGSTNAWTIREPPFDGSEVYVGWEKWGGLDPSLTYYANYSTGVVGARSEYVNNDASDLDLAQIRIHTSVGFWIFAPKARKLEMWIKCRAAGVRYHIWRYDEFGWSDYTDMMDVYWTVNISPGVNDADYKGSWSIKYKGDPEEEEKTFAAYIVPTNEERWLHLATSEILPGNAWTYVKFGTYETQWVMLNDVSIDSVLENRWFFEEVHFHFLD